MSPLNPAIVPFLLTSGGWANASVNFYNAAEQRKLQVTLQKDNQDFQLILQRETFDQQAKLAAEFQFFQMARDERAIDHQKEMGHLSHERQRELMDYAQMLKDWPLTIQPWQFAPLETSTLVPQLNVLIAPLEESRSNPPSSSLTAAIAAHKAALRSLRSFIEINYSAAVAPERPVGFVGGAWRQDGIRDEAAVLALFRGLKGIPTLVLQPELVDDASLEVRFNYWGLSASSNLPIHGSLPIVAYSSQSPEKHSLPLVRAYQFLTALFSDSHFLLHAAGRTRPTLPQIMLHWRNEPGALNPTVEAAALNCAANTYHSILSSLASSARSEAGLATLEIAEGLLDISFTVPARLLLEGAVGIYMPLPDAPVAANQDPLARILTSTESLPLKQRFVRAFSVAAIPETAQKEHLRFEAEEIGDADGLDLVKRAHGFLNKLINQLGMIESGTGNLATEPILRNSMTDALNHLQGSEKELRRPVFRLATMASTSAGKSTLINAFIGREIAPRSSKEMSAGTLTISHGRDHVVEFTKTEGMSWKWGRFTHDENGPYTDHAIYSLLKAFMMEYHKQHETGDPELPKTAVEAPLLPVNDPSLLTLPPVVRLQILDLPGINSTNLDVQSLKDLITSVKSSFCIFVFDYNDTTEIPSNILKKMKDVIIHGNSDGADVLFVLNKYLERDRADSVDDFEADLVAKRRKIKDILELTTLPYVVVVEARLWCDAQLAWGDAPLHDQPTCSLEQRVKYLKEIKTNYRGKIDAWVESDPELQQWWEERSNLKDLLVDDLRYFIQKIAYPMSGADVFFQILRDRVRNRLGSILLKPIFRDSLTRTLKLLGQIAATSQLRSAESLEVVEIVAADLHQKMENIKTYLLEKSGSVAVVVDSMKQFLLTASSPVDQASPDIAGKAHEQLLREVQKLDTKYQVAIQSMFEKVSALKNEGRQHLKEDVLTPLVLLEAKWPQRFSVSKSEELSGEFVTALQKTGVSISGSKRLAGAYCEYLAQLSTLAAGNANHRKIEYLSDSVQNENVALTVDKLLNLRTALNAVITERVKFQLQLQASGFQSELINLLRVLQESAERHAEQQGLSNNLFTAVMQQRFSGDYSERLTIPESMFDIQLAEQHGTTSKFEQVGEELEYYQTGLAKALNFVGLAPVLSLFEFTAPIFEERARWVAKYGSRNYEQWEFPSAVGICEVCYRWYEAQFNSFGGTFGNWAAETLEIWQREIDVAADELEELTNKEVDDYRIMSEAQLRSRSDAWKSIENSAGVARSLVQSIGELC